MTRNLTINWLKSWRVMCMFRKRNKKKHLKKVQRIVIHPEYKKLQNPVVEMYFISHRQPTVFVYRQFRRLIRPCRATSLFLKFLRTPPFFFRFNRDKSGPFRASSPAFPNSSWRISYMRFFFLWESWSTFSDTCVSLSSLWRKQNT